MIYFDNVRVPAKNIIGEPGVFCLCQENGNDCGVLLCQYAERIARKSSLNFSQRDLYLACARERMTQELLEGRINPDWRMVNWVKEVRKNQENRNENKGKVKEKGITCTVQK